MRTIARLPAREVLQAQLVGTIAAPLSGLVRGLNALIAGIAIQLQQIVEKGLVGGGVAPATAAPEPEPEAAAPEPSLRPLRPSPRRSRPSRSPSRGGRARARGGRARAGARA